MASSFAGVNLFGSGPHQIVFGGKFYDKRRYGFSGADGLVSNNHGARGRTLRITGTLKASTRAGVEALIENIETYCAYGYGTLIDLQGESWYYVELDQYIPMSPMLLLSTGYWMQKYQVVGMQII